MYSQREQQLLEGWVKSSYPKRIGLKTTAVCLVLDNGFEVVGTSSCINPDDYDYEEGVFYATKDALLKLKDIVGYIEQQQLHN